MHRSIPLSEIFSSTFSDDLNKYASPQTNNYNKQQFIVKIGIGLVEFLISSLFLCYGIIFAENVDLNNYSVVNGLWTTILYRSSWCMTGPWSRVLIEHADDYHYNAFRVIISAGTILLFIGLVLPGHILCYGIFGGVFSNLIHTQLKLIATEKFDMDLKVFEGNIQCARALSLLIMPHILLALVNNYSMDQIKLIFAAILLNAIPAMLIIKPLGIGHKNLEVSGMSRYNTLPAFSSQMKEMVEFTSSANTSDIHRSESAFFVDEDDEEETKDEASPVELINTAFEIGNEETLLQPAPLPPSIVQSYFSRSGVSILPEIPEEQEPYENDTDPYFIDSKRLSRISAKLNEERRESAREILNINDLISNQIVECAEPIQNIEYIPSYKDNDKTLLREISIRTKECCCSCCTSYSLFLLKRRLRCVKDFLLDQFFKPLALSLTDFHFYPSLISKCCVSFISTIYITLSPYLALQKNKDFKREDTTFLLSYMAFSWCFFLVLLPLIVTFTNKKLRYTFVGGLLLIGSSMLLIIKKKMAYDFTTLSCLLFGFGFGMVNFSENIVYKSFIGVRKWNLVEGTLETLSAIFVILAYYVFYLYKVDIVSILPLTAFAVYVLNALLWIVAPIVHSLTVYIKPYFEDRTAGDDLI